MLALNVNVVIAIAPKAAIVVIQRNLNDAHVVHVLVRIVVVQNDVIVVQNKKDLIRGLSQKRL